MTDQRELDRVLDAFFVDGTDELADRVIDAALDQIDHIQQRRAVRLPRRFPTMNMPIRVAAAAVIGVLAVGATLLLTRPGEPPASRPNTTAGSSPAASPSVDTSPSVVPPRATGWAITGDMVDAHSDHTATLLPDGKVLVAGGLLPYSGGFIASAELYNPTRGTWAATGTMIHPRGGTATLLQTGKVLVVGWDGGDAPKTAELFDPGSGTWAATGNMIGARPDGNTATLLPNGKVLVTGGTTRASAELYDPTSGKWTATGGLIAGRYEPTATLLPDGTVLLAGGRDTATANLYDPRNGTWHATGDMLEARAAFTATLLPNGKVLVAGGRSMGPDGLELASAELFDPATGTWTAAGVMSEARAGHTATLLPDGKVLVAGGSRGDILASAELYDPATGTWSTTASMAHPRTGTATLLRDGKVLVTGGTRTEGTQASAELYDPGIGN